MRVQETKPTGKATIMGKKKHKLRKQAKENELCPSDSSDEGINPGRCPHLSKAVNFNTMKKALKQMGSVGQCVTCSSDASSIRPVEVIADDLALGGATGGVSDVLADAEMFEDIEITIWVCLQCGNQGCDRNSKEQHALKHFETPRSNSHAVVLNVNTWTVWCYTCDDEVSPDHSRKLQECTEFIRKMMDSTSQVSAPATAVNRSGSFKTEDPPSMETASVDSSVKVESKPTKPKPISLQAAAGVTQGLAKVKGLSNLGNTCFFNAVMQNLSQTYILDTLLSEHGMKGASLNLLGDKCDREREDGGLSSDSSAGSEEDEDKIDLPPVSLSVGDPGTLTLSLISFMREMHNPGKSCTICPNSLFGQVCKKAPRFKGFQQQDSHELLRHLLDGMKAEEIKRSQGAILKQFHLAENTNPKKVDEETRLKVKEYGRQAKHTFVDEVFSGAFISTVQCEECHQPSQIYEPFLDISLPILEEKTVRHNTTWSWRKKDEPDMTDKVTAVDDFADKGPSKHMQKKAKRQAKREAKRKPCLSKTSSIEDEDATAASEDKLKEGDLKDDNTTKNNPDSRSQSDGEISDADVEDNIESDVSRTRVVRANSHEDDDRPISPVLGKPCVVPVQDISNSASTVCPHVDQLDTTGDMCCVRVERSDSTGRSEESTLTETSAGESNKAGCSSCNSIASLSDSTCKASSADSPFGSNTALNKPSINEITDDMHNLDIGDKNHCASHKCSKELVKDQGSIKSDLSSIKSDQGSIKSDLGSTASASMDTTETTSASNGVHRSSSHRSRSSGYSSAAATSKPSTLPAASTSRSQLRLQAKVKAMGSLAPRYQPVSHECSIRSCLNQFTACELLTGSNKFGCEACTRRKYGNSSKEGKKDASKKDTVYTNASKQVLIFQPPAILTLHLKRFQQVGFTLRKVNRHVEFPMILDLAPYCSSLCKGVKSDQTKVLYALYGVVEHSGRLTGGHYTAYVKVRPRNTQLGQFLNRQDTNNVRLEKLLETLQQNQCNERHADEEAEEESVAPPGKWYYISDSSVSEAHESSVLRCQAYLLFYERIL